jgi:hypothetical protein
VQYRKLSEETALASTTVANKITTRRGGLGFVVLATAVVLALPCAAAAAGPPADLQPIGGHWFVKEAEPPVYFYEDGGQFVDLFSYHARDSNKDGIDNVRLSHDARFLIIASQGYPNHPTAVFPNSRNPNTIRVQNFTFRLPLEPKLAGQITRLPRGPIGMALNGVVFFNPFEAEGMNAVEGYSEVWLDSCCGHPQQTGVYHYHKYPSCVKTPFADDGQRHSPVIGFAFDGFPVYGPYEDAGLMAKDLTGASTLDVCNGHQDESRGYHYHVTPGRFPYILGGYAGVIEASNNRGLAEGRTGAIENNAQPGTPQEPSITSVRPGTAARGKTHSVTIELNADIARRDELPAEAPSWVQIGPYEATSISRSGNLVTVDISIPADASVGILLDGHLEFGDGPRPMVIKKNDVFRVVE